MAPSEPVLEKPLPPPPPPPVYKYEAQITGTTHSRMGSGASNTPVWTPDSGVIKVSLDRSVYDVTPDDMFRLRWGHGLTDEGHADYQIPPIPTAEAMGQPPEADTYTISPGAGVLTLSSQMYFYWWWWARLTDDFFSPTLTYWYGDWDDPSQDYISSSIRGYSALVPAPAGWDTASVTDPYWVALTCLYNVPITKTETQIAFVALAGDPGSYYGDGPWNSDPDTLKGPSSTGPWPPSDTIGIRWRWGAATSMGYRDYIWPGANFPGALAFPSGLGMNFDATNMWLYGRDFMGGGVTRWWQPGGWADDTGTPPRDSMPIPAGAEWMALTAIRQNS